MERSPKDGGDYSICDVAEAEKRNFMSAKACWPNTRDLMEVMVQYLSINYSSFCHYKWMSASITPTAAMAILQDYRR